MKAIGIMAAGAACLALAGCDRLGMGGQAGNQSAAAGNVAVAPPGAKPVGGDNVAAAADPGAGLGGKDNAGAIQAGSGAAGGGTVLDRAFVLGRWTDDEDCDNAVDFFADGRFHHDNGTQGLWNLNGDRLTLQTDSTTTVQLVPVDRNSMTVVNADGSLGHSTRC